MTVEQKTLPPTVLTMVRDRLIDDGYDGLYNENGECGCDLNSLMPCECISDDCRAGYKVPCDCCDDDCEHDWMIVPEKTIMVNDPDDPKAPNVTRTKVDCQHHHNACYCREAYFAAIEADLALAKAEVERLKAHTWEQERAAIAAWLTNHPDLNYSTGRSLILACVVGPIERGEHWPTEEEP